MALSMPPHTLWAGGFAPWPRTQATRWRSATTSSAARWPPRTAAAVDAGRAADAPRADPAHAALAVEVAHRAPAGPARRRADHDRARGRAPRAGPGQPRPGRPPLHQLHAVGRLPVPGPARVGARPPAHAVRAALRGRGHRRVDDRGRRRLR